MELAGAVRGHAFQLVIIDGAILHILVEIAVFSPDNAIPLAGDEVADADVLAGLCRAAVQVKAGVVYFTGCLPLQEHLAVAGGSGEADQSDDCLNWHG